MSIKVANKNSISEAVNLLKSNEIVVIPTETVYGLAANALEDNAVQKIFDTKQRPSFNPLIVHVSDLAAAEKIAVFNDEARKVANAFWPGALTLILPKRAGSGISDLVTAGLKTIAVRVPVQKTARAVLKESGLPLAAPSANASGEPSATTPAHALQSLGERCPMVLADGACQIGLESTVLDLSNGPSTILRLGAITKADLEPYLGNIEIDIQNKEKPKSPGQLLKHYAPKIPVRLKAIDIKKDEALLAFGSVKFMGIEGGGKVSDLPESRFRNLSKDADLEEAAANLFKMLRDLDIPENKAIAVMDIPATGIGAAMNERLQRAAEKA
jgi:L-threonylcarbamoyladenylate synthase